MQQYVEIDKKKHLAQYNSLEKGSSIPRQINY